jgi:hypothetical protein
VTERRGAAPPASDPALLVRVGRGAALGLVAVFLVTAPAEGSPKKLRDTLSGGSGERTVAAADLRFVFFHTRYRTTRVPAEDNPTRERTEILSDRDDCACLRLADYSRIRFSIIREIEVRTSPGQAVASVRVVRMDGKTHEYPATALYGGDGLAPPLLMVTVDGVAREFPLVLPEGGAWPSEMLVRALLTRPPPPPKSGSSHH